MKFFIIIFIILLTGCTARKIATTTKYKVTLDASPSYVQGGDGKGYIVNWQWQQIEGSKAVIENPGASKTTAIVPKGDFSFQLKTTDNLNQNDTAILNVSIK